MCRNCICSNSQVLKYQSLGIALQDSYRAVEAHDQILVSREKLTLFVNKLRTFFPALRTSRPLIDTCSTSPANHELRSQANGVFENHNAWVQAVPSFPSPTPSFLFLLSPHFSRGQNADSPVSSSLFAPRKRLLRRLMEMEQSALVSFAICNLFFIPPNPNAFSDWRRTCHVPRV